MKKTVYRMRCPQCGSTNIVKVRFGYPAIPTPYEKREMAAGRMTEGGDVGVWHDSQCKNCGHQWQSRKRGR